MVNQELKYNDMVMTLLYALHIFPPGIQEWLPSWSIVQWFLQER